MTKINFVTDSVCDIPDDLVKKYNIGVVPCYVNWDGQSYKDDGVELSREEFYRRLPGAKVMPTTAAPAPGLAKDAIMKAAESADHVVVVTTPARLSGIYNAMRLGAADIESRVTLIDSGTLTMGIGFQVLIGLEVAQATGDVEKVKQAITRVREHQRLYAGLATLEYLRRSGRVDWARAAIGNLLQIKPILKVKDGEVTELAKIRTFSKTVEKLVALTHEQAPLEKLAVLHTNNLEGAQALKQQLSSIAPEDTIIAEIGPTLGVHIGPGAVGVVTVSKSWRTD